MCNRVCIYVALKTCNGDEFVAAVRVMGGAGALERRGNIIRRGIKEETADVNVKRSFNGPPLMVDR